MFRFVHSDFSIFNWFVQPDCGFKPKIPFIGDFTAIKFRNCRVRFIYKLLLDLSVSIEMPHKRKRVFEENEVKHDTEKKKKERPRSASRLVQEIDFRTGEIIRTFPCIAEAAKSVGFSSMAIRRAIDTGPPATCGKKCWRYATEETKKPWKLHQQLSVESKNEDSKFQTAKGFPLYEVNRLGQIRNAITERLLKSANIAGYPCVTLAKHCPSTKKKYQYKSRRLHRIIAETFVPNSSP